MDIFNTTNEYSELIKGYRLIAENLVECIWLFDLQNKCYKYVSPSVANLIGVTVEEAMQGKLEDCLTTESVKKMHKEYMDRLPQFLEGDRSEDIVFSIDQYELYSKDGTIKTVEISTKLILNDETNSVDILGVSRDMSYRKKINNRCKFKLKNVHGLFGIDNGHICCFGKLLVYGNSNSSLVKWRTSKSEELFAYLLENREKLISKWKICDDLWSQYNPDKINNILHTTLYKMKKALKLANINFDIKFINGCYYFSIPDVYIDTVEFDNIVSYDIAITENNVEKYKRAFYLYKNHYLEENDFNWAVLQKEIYSSKYYQLGKKLIDYYLKMKSYNKAENIINSILKRYPLDEFANEICLKLYYMKNDRISFVNKYQLTEKLFKEELGIQLNYNMKELYKAVMSEI